MTYSNTFIHLATRLQIAIDSCEPDIHKLLAAVNECLVNLDALLGGNALNLQIMDFDKLNIELNALIKANKISNSVLKKEVSTQTDSQIDKEINDIYKRIKEQKIAINGMIDELSAQLCGYLPPRKTLKEIRTEFVTMRDYHLELYQYLEFIKCEIIKYHIRPGKERIDILVQERLDCQSKLVSLKESLWKNHYYYRNDLDFKSLDGMMKEFDLIDLKMKSLLDILSQVAQLQESKESISKWIFKEWESDGYMEELEIKLNCFTSQERLERIEQLSNIRKFEWELFGNYNPFQRELFSVYQKKDSMHSVLELEKQQDKKFREYILKLWNQGIE